VHVFAAVVPHELHWTAAARNIVFQYLISIQANRKKQNKIINEF
jgi:hypothetical protein